MRLEKKQLEVVWLQRFKDGTVGVELASVHKGQKVIVSPANIPQEFTEMTRGVGFAVQNMMETMGPIQTVHGDYRIVLSAEEYEKFPLQIGALIDAAFDWPDQ
jgi:hypothetical protein